MNTVVFFFKSEVSSLSDQYMAARAMDHIALRKWQLFQEESLMVNWQENQSSSKVERQARDLEVRIRAPVQVQIFLLKFNNVNVQRHKL